MARFDSARWTALILMVVCCLASSGPVEAAGCCPSQTTCTTNPNPSTCTVTAPANACLNSSKKGFFPSYMNPTATVYIFKYMAANQNCDLAAPANNAFCNPSSLQNVSRVDASALGTQLTNNPSCSWSCAGACGSIVTSAAADGLPVELMDFGFEDEEPEAAADADADAGGD